MKSTYMYVLKCPTTSEVRYVGKANNPKDRYRHHLSVANYKGTHKCNWINSLRQKSLKPVFEIIKEVTVSEWKYWERHFIKYYRGEGCKLVNTMDGGEGLSFGNQTSFKKGLIPWNDGTANKKICAICGEEFGVPPSRKERYKCCSMKCSSVYRSIHPNKGHFKKGYVVDKNLVSVIQINKETGDVVNIFKSQAEAYRITGINKSHISSVTLGRRKTAGGFKWKRKENL